MEHSLGPLEQNDLTCFEIGHHFVKIENAEMLNIVFLKKENQKVMIFYYLCQTDFETFLFTVATFVSTSVLLTIF